MDAPSILPDFSLVKGGLLYRAERRLRLASPQRDHALLGALASALLAWLPLLLFTLPRGGMVLRSLFEGLQVHARLLIAVPVLVAAEPYVDGRISHAARQFLASRMVEEGSLSAFERSARALMRWRDSTWAEVCLLMAALALAFTSGLDFHREWAVAGADSAPTLAGWWYLVVSQTLFQFLALRWIWRGLLWVGFLLRVSRLRLSLLPTHPDLTGGLGFLPICQSSFAPVAFALAVVVASYTWDTQELGLASRPLPYLIPLIALAGIAVLVVFSPLAFFTPQLLKAKRRGDAAFSALAAWHSRQFERKWFHGRTGKQLLGAPEFSSLADLGTAFTVTRRMHLLPWDRRALLIFVAAALAPLPILLMMDGRFLAVLKQLHDGLR